MLIEITISLEYLFAFADRANNIGPLNHIIGALEYSDELADDLLEKDHSDVDQEDAQPVVVP